MRRACGLHRSALLGVCLGSALAVCGCYGRMSVRPHVEAVKKPYVLACGDIQYDGNARYLPATVAACESGSGSYTMSFSHAQDYTGTRAEYELVLSLLPSYLVGSPTGKDKVYVYSQLKVAQDGREVATYSAACLKESYRTIFSGAVNNSEGRLQCLDALRVNIENQMLRDEQFWTRRAER
ncbi:MAG TPA: hypothetical protein VN419_09755 [Humidesulfovibrio sp.]|uniref:hypothetical protein n=1 Tax=Humidesulfovibrio sp. TaxID=2910988 RepID=UPI002CCABD26|nr:hypothetical protein [Humidesulfovibrio sp.]HWR04292.1 hypothetical protein [Humidesulfovibrio sp.]